MPYTIWDHLSDAERQRLKDAMPRAWNPELEELAEIERLLRKAARGKQAILTKGGSDVTEVL